MPDVAPPPSHLVDRDGAPEQHPGYIHHGWLRWLETVYHKLTEAPRTATTAQLADVDDSVNTDGHKNTGLMVYNTTTNKPVWADGPLYADVWVDATGSTAHSPV